MAEKHRLRLFENYRFILYAPFYAAHAIGAYGDEGVEVELLPSPGPGRAEAAVLAGEADVMWMGPIRIMKQHDEDPGSPLAAFAEVVCRDPFSLVGARPNPDFHLSDLPGLRFASVSEVPTPWLCLAGDLHGAGIDPARLNRIADRTMADNTAGLRNGITDVAQMFEPFVQRAVAEGGAVWLPASARGLCSYTVFATSRERLARDAEPFARMTRAVARTLRWVADEPPGGLAAAIASYFPDLDRDTLTGSLARYKAQRVWSTTPVLTEEGFNGLRDRLLTAGFLKTKVPFADCVDNSLAMAAAGQG